MECVECGAVTDERAQDWRGYRVDEPDTDEPRELAFYCRECADREYGPLWLVGPEVDERT
jgi:hypothetical protein